MNDSNNSDKLFDTEILLGENKVFTSQPGFQSTSLEKDEALDFSKPP